MEPDDRFLTEDPNTVIVRLFRHILDMPEVRRLDLLKALEDEAAQAEIEGKRDNRRFCYNTFVTFHVLDETFTGLIKDISQTGIFIKTDADITPGRQALVEIPNTTNEKIIKVPALIVRKTSEGIALTFDTELRHVTSGAGLAGNSTGPKRLFFPNPTGYPARPPDSGLFPGPAPKSRVAFCPPVGYESFAAGSLRLFFPLPPSNRPARRHLPAELSGACYLQTVWPNSPSGAFCTTHPSFKRAMLYYLIKRVGLAIVIVVVAMVMLYSMIHMVPGDPVAVLLGPRATDEIKARVRTEMGLDKALPGPAGPFFLQRDPRGFGHGFFLQPPGCHHCVRAASPHPCSRGFQHRLGRVFGHSPGLFFRGAAQQLSGQAHRRFIRGLHRHTQFCGERVRAFAFRRGPSMASGHRGRSVGGPLEPVFAFDFARFRHRSGLGGIHRPTGAGLHAGGHERKPHPHGAGIRAFGEKCGVRLCPSPGHFAHRGPVGGGAGAFAVLGCFLRKSFSPARASAS